MKMLKFFSAFKCIELKRDIHIASLPNSGVFNNFNSYQAPVDLSFSSNKSNMLINHRTPTRVLLYAQILRVAYRKRYPCLYF